MHITEPDEIDFYRLTARTNSLLPRGTGRRGRRSSPRLLSPDLHRVRLTLGMLGLIAAGCSGTSLLPPAGDTLALGTWGGDDAGVVVGDSVTHLHVGCTFGDILGTIPLDANGRFTVDGSYVLRAYPVMVGPPLPAQFSGQVAGRTLTLAIAVNDTVENRLVALGPVVVVYERSPVMGQCPICRTPTRFASLP
jgi:hypothetical protein